MASIISAGTTSGTSLNLSGDTSGVLQLASNGSTTAVTVTTAQLVGVGTASPSAKLHVSQVGNPIAQFTRSDSGTGLILASDSDGPYFRPETATAIRFNNSANSAELMRITNGGDVFIGTSTTFSYANGDLCVNANGGGDPAIVAGVNSTSSAYNNIVLGNSTGGVGRIQTNGSATAYLTSSDYRLKKDVTPIQDALGTIESLNPVAFTWNVDNRQDTGFLAHEFQEILPNYADGTKDGVDANGKPAYQAVDKSGAIPFLVKAIQELNAKVEAQAVRIAELEGAK